MSLTHDIIKIKYSRLGYLPNFPYHLISDEEMFNAFIDLSYTDDSSSSGEQGDSSVERFFEDTYPNPFLNEDVVIENSIGEHISLNSEYCKLKYYIVNAINSYLLHKDNADANAYTIPDWIYTYMLGEVIYNNSDYLDIHDLLVALDMDNIDNVMTPNVCATCYTISTQYISTLSINVRPPTVFGEPHVIKQLRLEV